MNFLHLTYTNSAEGHSSGPVVGAMPSFMQLYMHLPSWQPATAVSTPNPFYRSSNKGSAPLNILASCENCSHNYNGIFRTRSQLCYQYPFCISWEPLPPSTQCKHPPSETITKSPFIITYHRDTQQDCQKSYHGCAFMSKWVETNSHAIYNTRLQ